MSDYGKNRFRRELGETWAWCRACIPRERDGGTRVGKSSFSFDPARLINILSGCHHYNLLLYTIHPIDIVQVEVTIQCASSEISFLSNTVLRLIYG